MKNRSIKPLTPAQFRNAVRKILVEKYEWKVSDFRYAFEPTYWEQYRVPEKGVEPYTPEQALDEDSESWDQQI